MHKVKIIFTIFFAPNVFVFLTNQKHKRLPKIASEKIVYANGTFVAKTQSGSAIAKDASAQMIKKKINFTIEKKERFVVLKKFVFIFVT